MNLHQRRLTCKHVKCDLVRRIELAEQRERAIGLSRWDFDSITGHSLASKRIVGRNWTDTVAFGSDHE
jgi:hypothetical protein